MPNLNQTLVNWQVAPAEFELANYDEPKSKYRNMTKEFLKPIKKIRKKIFFTISTNVLCADTSSSKDTIDPIDRDLYLPLEISITKWCLADSEKPIATRNLETKVWMMNPGSPATSSLKAAREHKHKHKIDFDIQSGSCDEQNPFVESDLSKIMKDINSFLGPDRTVFSIALKHVRQDLGSLKWLNKQTGYKSKPISVLSLTDLFVLLLRNINPNFQSCLSIAEYRLSCKSDSYNIEYQCDYHKNKCKNDEEGETPHCAKALSQGYSNVMVDDINLFGYSDQPSKSPQK